MIIAFQFFVVLVAVSALMLVLRKSVSLTKRSRYLWTLLWLAVILFVAFPTGSSALASLLGIGRGVDVLTYSAIFVMLSLLLRFHIRLEQQSRAITKLTRRLALKDK